MHSAAAVRALQVIERCHFSPTGKNTRSGQVRGEGVRKVQTIWKPITKWQRPHQAVTGLCGLPGTRRMPSRTGNHKDTCCRAQASPGVCCPIICLAEHWRACAGYGHGHGQAAGPGMLWAHETRGPRGPCGTFRYRPLPLGEVSIAEGFGCACLGKEAHWCSNGFRVSCLPCLTQMERASQVMLATGAMSL